MQHPQEGIRYTSSDILALCQVFDLVEDESTISRRGLTSLMRIARSLPAEARPDLVQSLAESGSSTAHYLALSDTTDLETVPTATRSHLLNVIARSHPKYLPVIQDIVGE
jgi:hypothetical protein